MVGDNHQRIVQDHDIELIQIEVATLLHAAGVKNVHVVRGADAQGGDVVQHGVRMARMVIADEQHRQFFDRGLPARLAQPGLVGQLLLSENLQRHCRISGSAIENRLGIGRFKSD